MLLRQRLLWEPAHHPVLMRFSDSRNILHVSNQPTSIVTLMMGTCFLNVNHTHHTGIYAVVYCHAVFLHVSFPVTARRYSP